MIGADLVTALEGLADHLVRTLAPPPVVAEGSHQGNVRSTSGQRDVKPENVRPGLVPCAECRTEQRPGAVHFARLTDIRPCVGSWRRR